MIFPGWMVQYVYIVGVHRSLNRSVANHESSALSSEFKKYPALSNWGCRKGRFQDNLTGEVYKSKTTAEG